MLNPYAEERRRQEIKEKIKADRKKMEDEAERLAQEAKGNSRAVRATSVGGADAGLGGGGSSVFLTQYPL